MARSPKMKPKEWTKEEMANAKPIPMPTVSLSRTFWVARQAGLELYFNNYSNEGTAWTSLQNAWFFVSKEEAEKAISEPVIVELCEVDSNLRILRVETA